MDGGAPSGSADGGAADANADAAADSGEGGEGGDGDGEVPTSRQFIQTALVGHKMWRNLSFWEEAFYRSIRDEVRKAYGRQLAAGNAPAAGGGDGATTDASRAPAAVVPDALRPDSREWQYMYQQIVFGQLGSYAMNMRAFGVQDAAVDRVVRRLGHGNGLPEEYLQVLFSNAAASRR